MKKGVAADIRAIFNAPDGEQADMLLMKTVKRYEHSALRLADWLEANIPEGFTALSFPMSHRRFIRTTNVLERVSQEIMRRTKVVRIFPNEVSCLRLISAILMEYDETWQTGSRYLTFEKREPPS